MKTFIYKSVVAVGDTDLSGNVFLLNCLKLTALVRELWLATGGNEVGVRPLRGARLIPRGLRWRLVQDFSLLDPVRCELTARDAGRGGAEMTYRFYHDRTNKLHAEVQQTVGLADRPHGVEAVCGDFMPPAESIEDEGVPVRLNRGPGRPCRLDTTGGAKHQPADPILVVA